MKTWRWIALVLLVPAASHAEAPPAEAPRVAHVMRDVVDVIRSTSDLHMFARLLGEVGLVEQLRQERWTIFAPTDAAFAQLPKKKLDRLLRDPAKLKQALLYHIVGRQLDLQEIATMKSIGTMQGRKIRIRVKKGDVLLEKAKAVQGNINASNGILHTIDRVLLP